MRPLKTTTENKGIYKQIIAQLTYIEGKASWNSYQETIFIHDK